MKLVTFERNGAEHIGIAKGDGIVDLAAADSSLPRGMIELMAQWPRVADKLRKLEADVSPHVAIKDIHLLAPIPRPQKILAIGLNYADHVHETGGEMPKQQIWFSKLPNSVNGPFDPIQIPKASSAIDYEAEFVVVIGKRCRHVKREDAASVIFGYCAGNDVSVRDWQMRTPQWILGKSFDTHAPFGPWILTTDEIGDPHTLGIRCFVNGEKRQDSSTCNLVFNVFDQIVLISEAMTLMPGDIIFTGTPGGVGMAAKPPNFLKVGDCVRVEIDRVGAIESICAAEP